MKMKLVLLAQPLIADVKALRWGMASTPLSMGSVLAMPHLRLSSVSAISFSGLGRGKADNSFATKPDNSIC